MLWYVNHLATKPQQPLVAHSRASTVVIPFCPICFSQMASPLTSLGKAETKAIRSQHITTSCFPSNSNLPLPSTPSSFQHPKKTNSLFKVHCSPTACQFSLSASGTLPYQLWHFVLYFLFFPLCRFFLSVYNHEFIPPLKKKVFL